jgi:hypothetical protein
LKNYFYFLSVSGFLIVLLLLGGCVRNYSPLSSWESQEFQNSDFTIHPNDIRQNLSLWKDFQIAWVGVIQECEFYETETSYEVILLLEHHYFDWKEENFEPDQMYYPSSLGQGLFQTSWYLKKSADLEYFKTRYIPGNLAIVYALPDTVIKDVVLVDSRYIRIIDRKNFSLDQSSYVPREILERPVPYQGTE